MYRELQNGLQTVQSVPQPVGVSESGSARAFLLTITTSNEYSPTLAIVLICTWYFFITLAFHHPDGAHRLLHGLALFLAKFPG